LQPIDCKRSSIAPISPGRRACHVLCRRPGNGG
jgi:hypothetical protein